jgi:alpha-galactosidase
VDLTGAQTMDLKVGDGGDGIDSDHGDWAGAEITLADGATAKPEAFSIPIAPPRMVMLPSDPHPAIHGPRVVGATPHHPFLFLSRRLVMAH